MGFPSKRGFQLSATHRFFSGCGLPSCWQCVAHTAGMERPDVAKLLWSRAAPKLPQEGARSARQAVAEARGQAAGPRLMEAPFLPPPLPTREPPLPFAEPRFLFMGKRDNESEPKLWRHRGGGLGRAPHTAACASPQGSCWCSKARQDMAEPPWPCRGPIASSLPAGTPRLPA